MKSKGLSLIEVLMALGLLAVLALMVSLLATGALRGARKASAVARVRAEGAYAMTQMSQMLRYARSVTNCTGTAVTMVSSLDGGITTFSCNGTRISSNSAFLVSDKVQTTSCSISCPGITGVNVSYVLAPAGLVGATSDESAAITFDSQIEVRNLPSQVNLAQSASIWTNSVYNPNYAVNKVADGIIGQSNIGEWASAGLINPLLRLEWSPSKTITTLNFYDRPNLSDNIASIYVLFSDLSELTVTDIPANGTIKQVVFPAKSNINYISFSITGTTDPDPVDNIGLSELEVIGY